MRTAAPSAAAGATRLPARRGHGPPPRSGRAGCGWCRRSAARPRGRPSSCCSACCSRPVSAGLLYLHTALAEDSFRLHDLATRSAVLADQEQALEQEVAEAASPSRLAERAEALGMVRSENPAFIRLSDGAVLGKPKPGVAPPPPPAPTPSASPSTSASAGTR